MPNLRAQRIDELVVLSATVAVRGPGVRSWYAALEPAGRYAELGRLRVRLLAGAALTHEEWARVLDLGDGGSYRAALTRDDAVRRGLVGIARWALSDAVPEIPESIFRDLRASAAFRRFVRALRADRRGRPHRAGRPAEPALTTGPRGDRLEAVRVAADIPLPEWADRWGVAPNTYRRYLLDEVLAERNVVAALERWSQAAEDLADRMADTREPESAPPIDAEQLESAYAIVSATTAQLRNRLRSSDIAVTTAPSSSSNLLEGEEVADLTLPEDEEDDV